MSTKKIRWMQAAALATLGAASIGLAGPANADVDTDFANELHIYGIYGQRDYNAWIGKITCKRLRTGLDANAGEAAVFLKKNLHKDSTEQQVYQFLNAAINFYCIDQRPVVDSIAGVPSAAPLPAGAPLPAEQG
ncbi:hypothetical protein ABIA65_005762 [Mycolicibacterium sp. 624]|jgi:hypothetical protein